MSDDTPTQRYPEGFPPPGSTPPPQPGSPAGPGPADAPLADAPTERFAASPATPAAGNVPPAGTVPPAPPTASGGGRDQKPLIITLAVVAGVLLLGLIGVLIWIAVASGSPNPTPTDAGTPTPTPTPTESDTPTPTPTPTETTAPPPPPNAITSYTASTSDVDCTGQGGGAVTVEFSWAATGETLWFGVGTDDARAEPYGEFPLNYTMDFDYQCGQPDLQQRYTITVLLADGSTQSQTIVIRES